MNLPQQPPDLRAWNAVLDSIQETLDTVDSDGLLDLDAEFDPPDGLEAMPEVLHGRAQALLGALNATMARVAEAQQAVGQELAQLATHPRRPERAETPPTPRMVDHQA